MTKGQYTVILVYSTGHALRAEKILQQVGIGCRLVPVPRNLSSDCGVCVRFDQVHRQAALNALQAAQVEMEGIHDI